MNLKEAFRFQNKLEYLIGECCSILSKEQNIMQVENTCLRKKVMEGAENETVREAVANDYADHINEVIDFTAYLLGQKELLCAAIHESKERLPVDMDSEIVLNRRSDQISAEVDRCLATSEVTYTAPFDVNDGFVDIFEGFIGKQ